jgi:hypothetical protein
MDDLETEDLFVQRRFMAIAKPTPVIIRKAHQHFPWIASTPLLKKIFRHPQDTADEKSFLDPCCDFGFIVPTRRVAED